MDLKAKQKEQKQLQQFKEWESTVEASSTGIRVLLMQNREIQSEYQGTRGLVSGLILKTGKNTYA